MKIVDMHCDTIVACYKHNKHLDKNDLHIDVEKFIKGDYLLQNMAIFLDMREEKNLTNLAKDIIKFYDRETDNNNINRIYKFSDIKEDKINTMLTIEDSEIVPYQNLEEFYDLGVRMITLTWNYPNKVGFSNIDSDHFSGFESLKRIDNENGLTQYGKKYIKKMEEMNIIIDVSHGSNKLMSDVLDYSEKPFVASHSNCYSVTPVGRNINDDLLIKMIEKECVIGMNFCSAFLTDIGNSESKIDDLIKHIDHILDLGGENNVGFGGDLDGIDSKLEIKDASNMQYIIERLKKRYSINIVKKISHENVLSLYEKVLK